MHARACLRVTSWAITAALLAAACAGPAPAHTSAPPTPTTTPTKTQPAARPTPHHSIRPRTATPPFAVGVRTEVISEPTGYTPARGSAPAHAGRTLVTTFWYPTYGPAGGGDRAGAPTRTGPFPLVVFAHGYAVTPQFSEPLLHTLAAAGFVVAAPLFPIEGGGLPGPPSEADLPREPADISTVIGTVIGRDAAAGGWLSGVVRPDRVAVVGHSDGAEALAAMLLDSTDPRIDAAVILAGQVLPGFPAGRALAVPTLVEQGRLDVVNPPVLSEQLFAQLVAPKAYLDVVEGIHTTPVNGTGSAADVVRACIVAFLDATLRGSAAAWARLTRLGDVPGVTGLTVVGAPARFTGR